MTENFTSLTINGKKRSKEHLLRAAKAYNSEFAVAGWEKILYDFIADWLSGLPTMEVRTSGSTGPVKTVMVSKEKMVKSAQRTGEFLSLKKNDMALLCLPINFIAGKMMVVRAFVLGLDLITVKPSSKPLEDFDGDVDFAAMTPMQVFYAMQSPKGFEQLQKIKKLIIGGGPVNHSLLSQISKLNTEVWHTYGMAETLTHVALKKLNGTSPDDHFNALSETTFKQDNRGCLVIQAPWLSNKDIVTKDLVDLIDDKTFDFKGRFDNIINSGGIKISPEPVESKIQNFLKTRCIVIGLPDVALGQKTVLVIEGKNQSSEKIINLIDRANLSKYERPKEIRFMYHFPQTESGKILRKQIADHFTNQNNI